MGSAKPVSTAVQGAGRVPRRRAMPCLAGKARPFLLRSGGSGAPRQLPCREMSPVAAHSTGIQGSEGSGIGNVGVGMGAVASPGPGARELKCPTQLIAPLLRPLTSLRNNLIEPQPALVGLTCRYSSSPSTLQLSARQLAQGLNGEAAHTPAGESKATTLESCLEPCRVPERTTNPRWGVRIQSPRPRVCRQAGTRRTEGSR